MNLTNKIEERSQRKQKVLLEITRKEGGFCRRRLKKRRRGLKKSQLLLSPRPL